MSNLIEIKIQMFSWMFEKEDVFRPEFIIVEYCSNYFPVRKGSQGSYNFALDVSYASGSNNSWKKTSLFEEVDINYPDLYALSTMFEARLAIERLEGVELEQIKVDNFKPFNKGNLYFFDRKEKVIEWKKKMTEGMTVDELIDFKFTDDEILKTKIGAELTSYRDK